MTVQFQTMTDAQMRVITRKAAPEAKLFRKSFYKNVLLSKTDKILIESLPGSGRKLAPRVSPRVPGLPIGNRGSAVTSFSPTSLKLNTPVDPSRVYEMMEIDPFSVLHNADPMVRHANERARISKDHVEMIERTWEFMAAMATIRGYVDTAYLGQPAERISFGRDGALDITLAPEVQWDQAGAAIVDAITEFRRNMADSEGGGVAVKMFVGSRVASVIRKSARNGELKDLMDTRFGADGTTLIKGLPSTEPVSYMGRISDLVDVIAYEGVFEDIDEGGNPIQIRPLQSNEILLTAADIGGVMAFGRIKDLAAGYDAVPIFGRNLILEGDPRVESIIHQSCPIAIPTEPNKTLLAKVLAD